MLEQKRLLSVYERLYSFFGPQKWWPVTSREGDARFEIMVGAVLTQNTAWKNVEKAIAELGEKNLLAISALARSPLPVIRECVRSSGYYNQKALRVKGLAVYLRDNYGGDLTRFFKQPPGSLRHELLSLHGVGPETADSILLYAGGKPSFVVDAYTKRVFARLGFLTGGENYDEVKNFFEKNLARDAKLFNEFHALIVALGKDFCLKKKPLCWQCPLRESCLFP